MAGQSLSRKMHQKERLTINQHFFIDTRPTRVTWSLLWVEVQGLSSLKFANPPFSSTT